MKRFDLLKHVRFKNKLRLLFHRSNKNIYLQLIDDSLHKTIYSVSTLDKDFVKDLSESELKNNRANVAWAEKLANGLSDFILKDCADRSLIFDRNNFCFGMITDKIVQTMRNKGIKI